MRKINLTYLPEYYIAASSNCSTRVRSKCSEISEACREYLNDVSKSYKGTLSQRRNIIDSMNHTAMAIVCGDSIDISDDSDRYSIDDMKNTLSSLYIEFDKILWDLEIAEDRPISKTVVHDVNLKNNTIISAPYADQSKSDISLKFKCYPCIDIKQVWGVFKDDGGRPVPIYKTLPEIPKCQNDISITTDFTKLSDNEFLSLFPNNYIRVRRDDMYIPQRGFDYDDILGFIPKISGFTDDQIKDNIMKYPQFAYLYRVIDGHRVSFFKYIEIDGELLSLSQAIESVPDMIELPKNKVFYWDYIIRRYLLERDIHKIKHKYPLYTYFQPFMTLFMPSSEYINRGYSDVLDIAKSCVKNRIRFYQSINPLTKEMNDIERLAPMHL